MHSSKEELEMVSFLTPVSLAKRLKIASAYAGTSRSEFLRQAAESFLEKMIFDGVVPKLEKPGVANGR